MKNTEDIIMDTKAQWNKVKTEVEHLGVQIALGRYEAKEAFDREWKKFSGFLDEQGHRLRRRSNWADKLTKELGERTKTLKAALKDAAPENDHIYTGWREKLLRMVYELEYIIDELYPVLDMEEKELLSTFRIKMEVYRTRLIMVALEDLKSLDTQATHLADTADAVLIWLEKDATYAREKMQQFGKEISTSFDHMKQAFSGLLK